LSTLVGCSPVSCSPGKRKNLETRDHHNFIILLDLSDRLIKDKREQIEADKKIIFEIWKHYREISGLNYRESRDIFQVFLSEQDSSSINIYSQRAFQDSLTIDLSTVRRHRSNKKKIKCFESKLVSHLDDLYSQASKSNHLDDYRGADIWKFFNDDLSGRLEKGYKNHVFILTDGYQYVKNKITEDSNVFPRVKLSHVNGISVDVCMLEISPKSIPVNEYYRLKSVWSNWFLSMGLKEMCFLKRNNLSQISKKISDFLDSQDRSDFRLKKTDVSKIKGLQEEMISPQILAETTLDKHKFPIVSKKTNTKSSSKKPSIQIRIVKDNKVTSVKKDFKTDAEFLDYFLTTGIYNPDQNSQTKNLQRVKNILEASFPSKASESHILLSSCKSKIKNLLESKNLLSEDLRSKFNSKCP
jgi:hypothetical protein